MDQAGASEQAGSTRRVTRLALALARHDHCLAEDVRELITQRRTSGNQMGHPPRSADEDEREAESAGPGTPGSCAQSIDSERYPANDGHQGRGQLFDTAKACRSGEQSLEKSWPSGTCKHAAILEIKDAADIEDMPCAQSLSSSSSSRAEGFIFPSRTWRRDWQKRPGCFQPAWTRHVTGHTASSTLGKVLDAAD